MRSDFTPDDLKKWTNVNKLDSKKGKLKKR